MRKLDFCLCENKGADQLRSICEADQHRSLHTIFFPWQDSCLADCKFLLDKTQFCGTVLYVNIVILLIFAGHLSDKIKYFASQNETLLVLTGTFREDCVIVFAT